MCAASCTDFFFRNDRGLLRATAVKTGMERIENKSLDRNLSVEEKVLPTLLLGIEPAASSDPEFTALPVKDIPTH